MDRRCLAAGKFSSCSGAGWYVFKIALIVRNHDTPCQLDGENLNDIRSHTLGSDTHRNTLFTLKADVTEYGIDRLGLAHFCF